MKKFLSLIILSSLFCACNNKSAESNRVETDTAASTPLDSVLNNDDKNNSSALPPSDPEIETKRQITEAIFSSKKEIDQLKSDITDSLTQSGLSHERKNFFSNIMLQLESSSDILNKQLEQILVSDLQKTREKLDGIVTKMKGSQKELQTMVGRLDKISGYLQIATNLIQSLSPIKPVIVKPATKPA